MVLLLCPNSLIHVMINVIVKFCFFLIRTMLEITFRDTVLKIWSRHWCSPFSVRIDVVDRKYVCLYVAKTLVGFMEEQPHC